MRTRLCAKEVKKRARQFAFDGCLALCNLCYKFFANDFKSVAISGLTRSFMSISWSVGDTDGSAFCCASSACGVSFVWQNYSSNHCAFSHLSSSMICEYTSATILTCACPESPCTDFISPPLSFSLSLQYCSYQSHA